MSRKKKEIAEVVQMYKIRQEEEKCFPESPFRLSFNDPLQENQRNKKGKTNLIFHLYCQGDLPKSKFRLVVYDGKQTEPQNPFWLMLLQTMFAAKAPTGQSHCGAEGKIKQPKYRDSVFKSPLI